jgi:hypothetical protein
MELVPKINIVNPKTLERFRLVGKEQINYAILEINPSRMTTNTNVKWLVKEFSSLFAPLNRRLNIAGGRLMYTPEMNVWWEVVIQKNQVRFYLVVPDIDHIKRNLTQHILRTWKRSNVREVNSNIPILDPDKTDISRLVLENHPLVPLDINTSVAPLASILNTKYYLKEDDVAILQIGMKPLGESWNHKMNDINARVKESGFLPKKRDAKMTFKSFAIWLANMVGIIAEELMNIVGDFFIPGWEDNTEFRDSLKPKATDLKSRTGKTKKKDSEGFGVVARVAASSGNPERRRSIVRSMVSGFHYMDGDNKLIEKPIKDRQKKKEVKRLVERKMTVRANGEELCSLELAKILQVPDQQAQIEHYNELKTVSHRSEADMPKEVLIGGDGDIPFARYEDDDGSFKEVYFSGKNANHLCMTRVVIGEPGTGKTTFAQNFALHAFLQGYGVFMIDAADGKMVQRTLDRIPPHMRDKVKIVDFLNSEYPIGLGWNEIFRYKNRDAIEDLLVEEVIGYITLVSGTELNMRARQWVESAIKAVFVTPDATLQDVENMLNNAEFREKVLPTIEDPELQADWEYFHTGMKAEDRQTIYNEAFRRLAPVMRKKALKNFILQKPKKDELGNYLVDIRRWMDEGYLVLIKANETLGETIQTALISFVLSKFNLAMISREDIDDEDDRKPCFLILDEPDHYIKGSERWRNMLTRYRKYRCGLVFMFHGWAQMKKTDKDLPGIMRQAGPHYIIFQTDEKNLEELRPVVEPDFKVSDLVKGMPEHHCVIKLKMFNDKGEAVPPFMAKGLGRTQDLFDPYDNNDLYESCALELGRPKKEVMDAIFSNKKNGEFHFEIIQETTLEGEGELDIGIDIDEEEEQEERRKVIKQIEREVGKVIQAQLEAGEDDEAEELLQLMDDIIEEG